MAASGPRLDQWLVTHGYAETRNRARWLIESGQVWVRGQPCRKPSRTLPEPYQVEIRGEGLPYVGRVGSNSNECCKPLASMSQAWWPWISGPQPADSSIACCSGAHSGSMPSMSGLTAGAEASRGCAGGRPGWAKHPDVSGSRAS